MTYLIATVIGGVVVVVLLVKITFNKLYYMQGMPLG